MNPGSEEQFFLHAANVTTGPMRWADLERQVRERGLEAAALVVAPGGQEWIPFTTAATARLGLPPVPKLPPGPPPGPVADSPTPAAIAASAPDPVEAESNLFCQAALRLGLISEEVMVSARSEQRRDADRGELRAIRFYLERDGALTSAQVATVLAAAQESERATLGGRTVRLKLDDLKIGPPPRGDGSPLAAWSSRLPPVREMLAAATVEHLAEPPGKLLGLGAGYLLLLGAIMRWLRSNWGSQAGFEINPWLLVVALVGFAGAVWAALLPSPRARGTLLSALGAISLATFVGVLFLDGDLSDYTLIDPNRRDDIDQVREVTNSFRPGPLVYGLAALALLVQGWRERRGATRGAEGGEA